MQKKMLRKSISMCQISKKNYSFTLDLEACAASDWIDESRIYSQPIEFQTWLPGKTKFDEKARETVIK